MTSPPIFNLLNNFQHLFFRKRLVEVIQQFLRTKQPQFECCTGQAPIYGVVGVPLVQARVEQRVPMCLETYVPYEEALVYLNGSICSQKKCTQSEKAILTTYARFRCQSASKFINLDKAFNFFTLLLLWMKSLCYGNNGRLCCFC